MMDYNNIAQQMVNNAGRPQQSGSDIPSLKHFLSTKQGRDATRGVIDSIVARKNITGQDSPAMYKDIIKTLSGVMQSGQMQ